MKVALLHLLLAGAPPFLVWNLASAEEVDVSAPVVVVKEVTGEGCESAGGDQKVVVVRAEVAPGKSDGRSETAVARVIVKGDKDDAQRGWLGVHIEEVPDALAAQLDTEGRGVLVSNVVEGSAADKAGFQVHDVIVSVNGEAVEGDLHRTVDLTKARSPGDVVKYGVLRDGRQVTLSATLGSRADMPATGFTWKFETAPDAEVKEHVKTRGKFIHKGPGGQWIVKDLGDLQGLADLPDNIKVFVPKGGEQSTQVTVDGGSKTIRLEVNRDGSRIGIEQKDDGPITVRRTDAGGNETVATYDDEDALRAADEEAHEVFAKAGQSVVINLDGKVAVDGDFEWEGDFDFEFDSDAWQDAMKQWRSQLDENLSGAHEAYDQAMEQLHESLSKLKGHDWDGALPMAMHFAHLGTPKNSFEVRTDGTIEVKVRKGDSELLQLYKSAGDLQQRNPDLYKKYQELQSIKD
jgi:hypothetical protein